MDTLNLILSIITFALFAMLITGLIKPRPVLPWCKKPNRWKVAGLFIILICSVAIFGRQLNLSDEEFNAHYSITGTNTVQLVKGKCDADVVVGKAVRYKGTKYTVTSIGNRAFAACDFLKSAVITDNVKEIGDYAFANCKNLSSIILPDSIKHIGAGAFAENISLNSINIPAGITRISNDLFRGCKNLASVSLSGSITRIDNDAFANCENLKSIILPDSIKHIGPGVFTENISLNSINIPAGITEINYDLFRGCKNLVSVSLSGSITRIGDHAFAYCENLKSITIPNSVKHISAGAFAYCRNLTDVTVPCSVDKISAQTFFGCTSLASVTLPDSLKRIENKAFADCSNITSMNIPNSAVYIADNAFDGCNGFSSDFKAYLNKRRNQIKAMQIEVFIKHPKTVYGMAGYNTTSGREGKQWEWTTSFTAKKNKKPIKLTTGRYTITSKGKTWNPGASVNPYKTIVIETDGKSDSVTETFNDYYDANYNLDWAGAVFSRTWVGEDEHGISIIIEETVHFH
jgi:hypothetical protein